MFFFHYTAHNQKTGNILAINYFVAIIKKKRVWTCRGLLYKKNTFMHLNTQSTSIFVNSCKN